MRTCWLLLGSMLMFCMMQFCDSDAQPTKAVAYVEWQVKAAYLYKFGSYVEWPEHTFPGADSPLVIGIVDADALADELIKIAANHTINGRSVSVRKLRVDEPVTDVNVLFISGANRERNADIFAAVRGLPVLTVTDADGGLTQGGMINFMLVDGHVRFEAAPKIAKQNNLSISARLLAAAYRVAPEAL